MMTDFPDRRARRHPGGVSTKRVAAALRPILGGRLHETPTTAQLRADDLLEIAICRERRL